MATDGKALSLLPAELAVFGACQSGATSIPTAIPRRSLGGGMELMGFISSLFAGGAAGRARFAEHRSSGTGEGGMRPEIAQSAHSAADSVRPKFIPGSSRFVQTGLPYARKPTICFCRVGGMGALPP